MTREQARQIEAAIAEMVERVLVEHLEPRLRRLERAEDRLDRQLRPYGDGHREERPR